MATGWKRVRSLREPSAKCTVWSLPTADEHVLNTGSPEDLLLDPEDFDIDVGRVQEHSTVWNDESIDDSEWYTIRMLDASWTDEAPTEAGWYVFDPPESVFYVGYFSESEL